MPACLALIVSTYTSPSSPTSTPAAAGPTFPGMERRALSGAAALAGASQTLGTAAGALGACSLPNAAASWARLGQPQLPQRGMISHMVRATNLGPQPQTERAPPKEGSPPTQNTHTAPAENPKSRVPCVQQAVAEQSASIHTYGRCDPAGCVCLLCGAVARLGGEHAKLACVCLQVVGIIIIRLLLSVRFCRVPTRLAPTLPAQVMPLRLSFWKAGGGSL